MGKRSRSPLNAEQRPADDPDTTSSASSASSGDSKGDSESPHEEQSPALLGSTDVVRDKYMAEATRLFGDQLFEVNQEIKQVAMAQVHQRSGGVGIAGGSGGGAEEAAAMANAQENAMALVVDCIMAGVGVYGEPLLITP